jgi:hypothetical protein
MLFGPNFNFEQMGIGGLDKEFSDIFRRAFASRVFPTEVVKNLGIRHVKGTNFISLFYVAIFLIGRNFALWASWNWKDFDCEEDWKDVERSRTENCQWA